MKTELKEKLEGLLQTDDIASIRMEVKEAITSYNAETIKERKEQQEKWDSEEHEEDQKFEFQRNELDEQFESLVAEFKTRIREHREKIAAEEQANLKAKKDLLDQLSNLVKEEENVGKAFSVFNEIRDKWNEIGNVPRDKNKDLYDQYIHLRDDFFYNINIYKELLENDLRVNENKKKELIEKAKKIKDIKSIRERDQLVRTYQNEWMNVGPSPRENYKELGDEFFGICRDVIADIRTYFDGQREQQVENLNKKKELVVQLQKIVDLEILNHGTWKKKTQQVLDLQKEWKTIGFAPKPDNDKVWEEFRSLCDKFFESKQGFYDKRKEEHSSNREAKEKLISKAESLKESQDWKETTQELIRLQDAWKKVGPAAHYDEQKLWTAFRAACDAFFNSKKEFFDTLDDRQEGNLKEKEALIKEIESYKPQGDRAADLASLKEFSEKWNAIGYVPKNKLQDVYDKYNAAMDAQYGQLNLDENERRMISFKQKIESIKESGDSGTQLRRERNFLRDKLQQLQSTVRQYETNMERFTGAGAESFKKDIEKRIKTAHRQIAEIEQKIDLIDS